MLNLLQTSKAVVVTKLSTPVEQRGVVYNLTYQSGLSNTKNTYTVLYETEYPTGSSLRYVLNYTSTFGNSSTNYVVRYTSGVDRQDKKQLYLVRYTVQYPIRVSLQYSMKYTSQSAEMSKNRRVFKIKYETEGTSRVSQPYTIRYRTPSLMKRLLDYTLTYASDTPFKTSFKVFNLEGASTALLVAVDGEAILDNIYISSYSNFYDIPLSTFFEYVPKELIQNEPLLKGTEKTKYYIWKDTRKIQECNIVSIGDDYSSLYSENVVKQAGERLTGPVIVENTSFTYFTELVNKATDYAMATTINPTYRTAASCCLQTKINDNTRRGECSPI